MADNLTFESGTKTRDQEMNWADGKLCASLSVAILVCGLTGCATTPTTVSTHRTATWSPGAPDALTSEHYDLAVAAIGRRAKTDAQAALNLLRDDVLRMQTNAPDMMAALALLYGVSNAVDAADWEKARKGILELRASYGPRQ